jgi:hypothetical protein
LLSVRMASVAGSGATFIGEAAGMVVPRPFPGRSAAWNAVK